MATVTSAALHSSLQLVTASAIGGLIDGLFPPIKPNNVYMEIIEAIAQVTLGGVVTAGMISLLDQVLDADSQDPTGGIGYTIGFMLSQPLLMMKIEHIMSKLRETMVSEPTNNGNLYARPKI